VRALQGEKAQIARNREESAMRKLISAGVVCALAIGLVAVPGAVAKKGVKNVGGSVSVNVTPTNVTVLTPPGTTPNPTTLTVTGNVASNSGCRKNRTVHFYYSGAPLVELTTTPTPVTTGPNGDYTATIPSPTTTGQTVLVKVDQAFRKFASKRKGKKPKRGRTAFNCQELTGSSGLITVTPVAPV
jgi:hypothetical protein